jgi:pimeloyl-ACP methyl ester carboxylesterase
VAADSSAFRLLEPLLAPHFTVVTVDRRGRLDSRDADAYSLEAEFDDLVEVVDSLVEPVTVFGHSFGANVALGAALRSPRIGRLVLYEPGAPGDVSPEFVAELQALVAAGERQAAMKLVVREFTAFPEEWLDDLLETPQWQERLAYAHTLAREVRGYLDHEYVGLPGLEVPTLLLVGSESPSIELPKARSLADVLPSARVSVLAGVGHVGPVTHPAAVAHEIVSFAAVDQLGAAANA